jgi:hypothetical protein
VAIYLGLIRPSSGQHSEMWCTISAYHALCTMYIIWTDCTSYLWMLALRWSNKTITCCHNNILIFIHFCCVLTVTLKYFVLLLNFFYYCHLWEPLTIVNSLTDWWRKKENRIENEKFLYTHTHTLYIYVSIVLDFGCVIVLVLRRSLLTAAIQCQSQDSK